MKNPKKPKKKIKENAVPQLKTIGNYKINMNFNIAAWLVKFGAVAWCLGDVVCGSASRCGDMSCSGSWGSWGGSFSIPCAAASGSLPSGEVPFRLPLIFEGNYDLCATFEEAKYCVLQSVGPVFLPKLDKRLKPVGVIPLGFIKLDQCVSTSCQVTDLRKRLDKQLDKLFQSVYKHSGENLIHRVVMDRIARNITSTLVLTCKGDIVSKLDGGGYLTLAIFCTLFIAVLLGSCFPRLSLLHHFSIWKNTSKLVAPIQEDFAALNGIRVISILWVVAGHTILLYNKPLMNPTLLGDYTQSFSFIFIKGAVFAVDTFLFMSGFLASWTLIKLFNDRFRWKIYFRVLAMRYLRLTPAYMGALFFTWKVLPILGDGPYWYPYSHYMNEACRKWWWTNVFYINNIVPWGHASAEETCFGHAWYLAVDFQCFLLVPFIVHCYFQGLKHSQSRPRALVKKYGPCAVLIIGQIIYVMTISYVDGKEYADRVYAKPYGRITPYAIGVLLALRHYERRNADVSYGDWKILRISDSAVAGFFVACIAMMFSVIGVQYLQYKCDATAHECQTWEAVYIYGVIASKNWGTFMTALYNSFAWLLWSVPLAGFSYILFCDNRYSTWGIKAVLSNDIFTPLARLTYNTYLIHIPLLIVRSATSRQAGTYVPFQAAVEFLGIGVLSYILSSVLYLILEKPMMNILKATFSIDTSTEEVDSNNPQVPLLAQVDQPRANI